MTTAPGESLTNSVLRSTLAADILNSIGLREQALADLEIAKSAVIVAEARVKEAEVDTGNGHNVAYAFVLKPDKAPLKRRYYSQDYDEDGEHGWYEHDLVDVEPGEVFTSDSYADIDYKAEVVNLKLRGDQRKRNHGPMSGRGTEVKSEIKIPFARLHDLDIYEYYPNDPERTREVCAQMAGILGVEEVVLHNRTLEDYMRARELRSRQ